MNPRTAPTDDHVKRGRLAKADQFALAADIVLTQSHHTDLIWTKHTNHTNC